MMDVGVSSAEVVPKQRQPKNLLLLHTDKAAVVSDPLDLKKKYIPSLFPGSLHCSQAADHLAPANH